MIDGDMIELTSDLGPSIAVRLPLSACRKRKARIVPREALYIHSPGHS